VVMCSCCDGVCDCVVEVLCVVVYLWSYDVMVCLVSRGGVVFGGVVGVVVVGVMCSCVTVCFV
jgi:hypothetical protein